MTVWALAACLALAGAAPEPAEHWRLVYQDGRVEAVDGELDLSAARTAGLRHAWYWSSRAAPRKVPHDELDRAAAFEDRDRIRVLVVPDPERRLIPGRRVVAAPLTMWDEVPEDLLPSWPVSETGTTLIPSTFREGWRARLVGEGEGTWWRELDRGQRTVTLEPAPADAIEIDAVDEDGQAVDGAHLYAVEGSPGRIGQTKQLARYRSADGSFAIPQLPDEQELTLMVTAGGYVPTALRGFPRGLPGRVRLNRGAVVRGRFVDRDEVPVPGVAVDIETTAGEHFPSFWKLRTKSDEEGRWEIQAVPPREAIVVGKGAGFAPFVHRLELESGTTDLGDVVLESSIARRVKIVDDLGEPVAAELRVRPGGIVVAGHDGEAVLEGISAGRTIELEADAPGYLPSEVVLRPPHSETATIRLERAFEVSGRFLRPSGDPVQRGVVTARTGRRSERHDLDATGGFELELVPDKIYDLELRSPETRELRIRLEPGSPGERRDLGDLLAPEGLVLSGRLLSGVDGAPVAGARVWTPRPSPGGPLVAWFYRDLLETRSQADGEFELRGLAVSAGRLRIDAVGFARTDVRYRPVPEDLRLDLGDVELLPGAVVRVLMEGFDAEGALARLDLGSEWLEVDMLNVSVYDGTAVFRDVPPGRATISVVRDRELLCEQSVEVPSDKEEVAVSCRASGLQLSGWVTIGGYPAGPGLLGWLPPATDSPDIIMTRTSSAGLSDQKIFGGGRPQVDVAVLDGGFFQTDKVRAGSWTVIWQPAGGQASEPRSVVIPEAEEFELTIDFPGHAITGVVRDSEGQEVAQARVRELVSGSVTFSATDGSFRLIGLSPAKRYLKAQLGERSSAVAEVELTADHIPEPIVLELKDQSPEGFPLLVVDASSRPVPGALIFVEAVNLGQRILTTGQDGRAELVLDPPHPAAVRFASYGNQIWTLGEWVPWATAREEPLVLEQGGTGTLLVEIAEGVEDLRILSPNGWDLSWLLTRIGLQPILRPGHSERFTGLPSGVYTLSAGPWRVNVAVEENGQRKVELGDD